VDHFSLIDVLKWMWSNLPIVFLVISVSTLFGVIVGITRFLRNIREGMREMMTPLGGIVTLIMIIIVIVVYVMIRSLIKPLNIPII